MGLHIIHKTMYINKKSKELVSFDFFVYHKVKVFIHSFIASVMKIFFPYSFKIPKNP
mgnify:CR=1 FL=1